MAQTFWKLHPKIIRQLKQEDCSLPKQIRHPCWIFPPSERVLTDTKVEYTLLTVLLSFLFGECESSTLLISQFFNWNTPLNSLFEEYASSHAMQFSIFYRGVCMQHSSQSYYGGVCFPMFFSNLLGRRVHIKLKMYVHTTVLPSFPLQQHLGISSWKNSPITIGCNWLHMPGMAFHLDINRCFLSSNGSCQFHITSHLLSWAFGRRSHKQPTPCGCLI